MTSQETVVPAGEEETETWEVSPQAQLWAQHDAEHMVQAGSPGLGGGSNDELKLGQNS